MAWKDEIGRPNCFALLRIREGEVVRALGEAEPHGRDRDPAPVEDLEELLETFTAIAEQVSLRHRAVAEGQLARV